MGAEVVGGLVSGSLALIADAGHMASDAAALGLTLFAIRFARRPATPRRTFGSYRAEIIAALVNGATLVAVALYIFIEAFERFQEPPEVQGGLMLVIAAGGLVVNGAGLVILHGGRGESLNMRGAWLHVLTDALGSLQAIVAGGLIWAYGWNWVDPVASVLIGLLVIYSSWSLITQSVAVLMEGAPGHVDVDDVRSALLEIPNVTHVHDLHVWTITSGFVALSAHVTSPDVEHHQAVLGRPALFSENALPFATRPFRSIASRTATAASITCMTTTRLTILGLAGLFALPTMARGQDTTTAQQPVHEHVDVRAALLTPTRDASGTSWIPASTPMYGLHQPWRGWDLRVTGSVFGQFVYEPTERHRTGGSDSAQLSGVSWGMAMIRRNVGAWRLGLRGMVSADAWTSTSCGALNLLGTGEVCQRDTVHDRQQPHDLLMELATDYERPLRGNWRWQGYAALAGEPALGPPGYSHRISAGANPAAPVSHHLIDPPTSFGVLTAGVHNGRWKFEASAFNGRDADESRTDVDFGALDSAAARVTLLPTDRLALQLSVGRVHEASSGFYGQPQDATSKLIACATYHRPLAESGIWATTIGYGVSKGRELIAGTPFEIVSDGLMVESTVTRRDRHSMFGRAEIVAMPAHHLHAHEFVESVFTTAKLQAGYARHFSTRWGLTPGFGVSASVSIVPDALAPRYYGHLSPGLTVFFQLRPARHQM